MRLHNTTDKNNLLVLNPFYMTTAFVFYSYATKDMSVIIEIYKYVRSVWLQVQLEVHFHFPSPTKSQSVSSPVSVLEVVLSSGLQVNRFSQACLSLSVTLTAFQGHSRVSHKNTDCKLRPMVAWLVRTGAFWRIGLITNVGVLVRTAQFSPPVITSYRLSAGCRLFSLGTPAFSVFELTLQCI